jgi:cytochrome c-type biogenesis protein CcmH/NrfG
MVMAGNLKCRSAYLVLALAALAACASPAPARLKVTVDQQRQAEQAYAGGDMAQALSGYQTLTRALPQNADFWFRLGNVYVRLERPDQAVDAYQHALQIEPAHAKAWHNLGIIRLRQAEAAFAQSAQNAAGVDAPLQQDSAAMVHGIAVLGTTATDSAPALPAVPATPSSAAAVHAAAGRQP